MTPWVGELSVNFEAKSTFSQQEYTGTGRTEDAAVRDLCKNISIARGWGQPKNVFSKSADQSASFYTKNGTYFLNYSLTQTQGSPHRPYCFGRQTS